MPLLCGLLTAVVQGSRFSSLANLRVSCAVYAEPLSVSHCTDLSGNLSPKRLTGLVLTVNVKRVFTEIDTNERYIFHDGLSRKKNTLPAYRSQGGGDHLISPLHIVSAFATEQGISLGQLAVDGKSNEITAVPELLSK